MDQCSPPSLGEGWSWVEGTLCRTKPNHPHREPSPSHDRTQTFSWPANLTTDKTPSWALGSSSSVQLSAHPVYCSAVPTHRYCLWESIVGEMVELLEETHCCHPTLHCIHVKMVQHIKGEGCLGPREAGSKKISLKELKVMGRAICTNTPLHMLMAHSSTMNNNNIILQGGETNVKKGSSSISSTTLPMSSSSLVKLGLCIWTSTQGLEAVGWAEQGWPSWPRWMTKPYSKRDILRKHFPFHSWILWKGKALWTSKAQPQHQTGVPKQSEQQMIPRVTWQAAHIPSAFHASPWAIPGGIEHKEVYTASRDHSGSTHLAEILISH